MIAYKASYIIYLQLDYEDEDCSPLKPNLAQLNALSETLRQKLGLDLFGVDVIIECDTQRYAVIDINVFPSKYTVMLQQDMNNFSTRHGNVFNKR